MFESIVSIFRPPQLDIRVAMLGPRRAGKTSVLTAMYERFENSLLVERVFDNIHLSAAPSTADVLQANYRELIRVIQAGEPIAQAITGDAEAKTYQFELRRTSTDAEPQIRLSFQDYPGGWLMAGQRDPSDPGYRKVLDFVREAQILLVAVDTPYLMEDGGRWHEARNLPGHILRTIREAWPASDPRPRYVLLVPIKCEKYDNDDRAGLVEATRKGYADLIAYLATLPHCGVFCTPAQTTGCVRFSRFLPLEPGDTLPAPEFIVPPDSGYAPFDCAQALRYCLFYAVNYYCRENSRGIPGKIRTIFKLDRRFVEAARKLAAGCHGTTFVSMKKETR